MALREPGEVLDDEDVPVLHSYMLAAGAGYLRNGDFVAPTCHALRGQRRDIVTQRALISPGAEYPARLFPGGRHGYALLDSCGDDRPPSRQQMVRCQNSVNLIRSLVHSAGPQ